MQKKKFFKQKKIVAEFCIAGLFFLGVLFYFQKEDVKMDVRMLMEIKVQNQDIVELMVNDFPIKARVIPARNFQTIFFKLPKTEVKKVQLFLGQDPGLLVIKEIKLKTLLSEYRWQGSLIPKLFNYSYNIKRTSVREEKFFIEPGDKAPSLIMVKVFSDIINKISRKKLFFYFLAIILALILFYFIHFFSTRGLKFFFTSGIVTNMVLVFFLIIFFPLMNEKIKIVRPFPIPEKRKLARIPEFRFDSLFEYLNQYSGFFNDHFSLRNHLVHINNHIRFKLFNKSTVPMVVIGKNGWLFMGKEAESRDELVYFRRLFPFSEKELAHWKQILTQRQKWLAERGIYYLLIIVPNKSTIYPEFMPDYIRPLSNPSRLDQLLKYIGENSGVKILDLRTPLLIAKKKQLVYSKTDSHWNHFGAYFSYLYIMDYLKSIFPGEESLPISDFYISNRNWAGGDLAAALSLHRRVLREDRIWIKPKNPRKVEKIHLENISPYVRQSISVCKSAQFPPAIFVHDSFINELRPFISPHFSQIRYIWDWELNIYPELIKKDRVKIVIEEMGERYLLDKVLTNPEEIKN